MAITPEGGGSGRLQEPPAGSGLFLAILSGHGYPLFPLAIWEEDSTLVLRVGEPFQLSLPRGLPRDEADRRAREQTMVAIGRLLPRDDWGVYASAIEASFRRAANRLLSQTERLHAPITRSAAAFTIPSHTLVTMNVRL